MVVKVQARCMANRMPSWRAAKNFALTPEPHTFFLHSRRFVRTAFSMNALKPRRVDNLVSQIFHSLALPTLLHDDKISHNELPEHSIHLSVLW
jgi:hypothetical protein